MPLSPNMEDYLEAIFFISTKKTVVRVKDVSRQLGVTMPSVNGALKKLEARGLIKHEKYENIELTRQGKTQASKIASKHSVIHTFLTDFLHVDPETAETEACGIEHVISSGTMQKLTEFIENKSK